MAITKLDEIASAALGQSMHELRAHLRAAAGFALLLLAGVWKYAQHVALIDFAIARTQEPSWIGDVMTWLVDPPWWVFWLLAAVGAALVAWDIRRSHKLRASSPALEPEWVPLADVAAEAYQAIKGTPAADYATYGEANSVKIVERVANWISSERIVHAKAPGTDVLQPIGPSTCTVVASDDGALAFTRPPSRSEVEYVDLHVRTAERDDIIAAIKAINAPRMGK